MVSHCCEGALQATGVDQPHAPYFFIARFANVYETPRGNHRKTRGHLEPLVPHLGGEHAGDDVAAFVLAGVEVPSRAGGAGRHARVTEGQACYDLALLGGRLRLLRPSRTGTSR